MIRHFCYACPLLLPQVIDQRTGQEQLECAANFMLTCVGTLSLHLGRIKLLKFLRHLGAEQVEHIRTYMYIPAYVHTYIRIYVRTYIRTCRHIYKPTYIHTHTHVRCRERERERERERKKMRASERARDREREGARARAHARSQWEAPMCDVLCILTYERARDARARTHTHSCMYIHITMYVFAY